VTWGAVQHQFGGKGGLFLAVVEDSFARFAARLHASELDLLKDSLARELIRDAR